MAGSIPANSHSEIGAMPDRGEYREIDFIILGRGTAHRSAGVEGADRASGI
jgi:hypothetical protein